MEINEETLERLRRMYCAAFAGYVEDCRAALHDRRSVATAVDTATCIEALDDLLGPRTQLTWLCHILELDVTRAAEAVMREIEDGRPLNKIGSRRLNPQIARETRL